MCIEQIISLITGIGTLTASLIALFALIEIKRQRKESIKPELAIKSSLVYVYGYKFKEYYLPFIFNHELLEDENKIQNSFSTLFNLKLVNVGLRSAKNITSYWDFDFKKAIELIKSNNKDGLFKLNLDNEVLEIYFLIDGYHELNMIEGQMGKKSIDFLLNSTPESFDTILLMFPPVVLKLYMINLCLAFGFYQDDMKGMGINDISEFPKLRLNLDYEDIAGVPYSKKFNFEIEMITFTNPMTTQFKHEFGMLQIKTNEGKN